MFQVREQMSNFKKLLFVLSDSLFDLLASFSLIFVVVWRNE